MGLRLVCALNLSEMNKMAKEIFFRNSLNDLRRISKLVLLLLSIVVSLW